MMKFAMTTQPPTTVSHLVVCLTLKKRDMELAPLAPPWLQAANFLFLLAALFNDILLIRFWLALAFVALGIFHVVESVSTTPNQWVVDGLGWVLITGIWHWQAATT